MENIRDTMKACITTGNKKLISVIIPMYNSEEYIKTTLYSALNQSYKNIEIIVIDDASTDGSVEIIRKIASSDNRIRLISNEINKGVAESRNTGILSSNGEYLAFLDSDDIWIKNKLEIQMEELEKSNKDVSYTSFEFIKKSGELTGKEYIVPIAINHESLLSENVICCSSVLIKLDAIKNIKFNKNYNHEDYVLWLELLREGKTFIGIRRKLLYYRKGGRSADKLKAAKDRWIVYRRFENLSILKSLRCFALYAKSGIKKYK